MKRPLVSSRLLSLLCAGAAAGVFGWASARLEEQPRPAVTETLRVRMPVPLQLTAALGDRYLAANINTFRATVMGTQRFDAATYAVLAGIQQDAALFNPAHEDNYYLASAVLPWEGQVEGAQRVLKAATDARPTDPYPPFYYGFNAQYFLGDYVGAARAAEIAASRVPGQARVDLLNIAAKWYERVDDPQMAEKTIAVLMNTSHDPALRQRLQARIQRVRQLALLRDAARSYQQQVGRPPASLDELMQRGVLKAIPVDPLGEGFRIRNGIVEVNRPAN